VRPDEFETEGVRFTGRLGFWEGDPRTGAAQWSGDIDDILGFAQGGASPTLTRLFNAFAPEERVEVEEALDRSIRNRFEHHHVEYRCRRPDGREVVVRNEWSVECDEIGKPILLRGIIQDITHRRRAKAALRRKTDLLELLYAIAARANEAETLDQALQTSLERICVFGGWPVGHVYLVSDGEHRELVPTSGWHAADAVRFAALRGAARLSRVSLGVGPPGMVARSGRPAWTSDIRQHASLPTTAAAIAAGLHAALDLPVLVGAETVAVLEFFSYDDRAPDQEVIQAMTHVAAQIGRVFERKRAEDALRGSEARLRQILESMPIGVFVRDAQGKPYFANKYARSITRPEPAARAPGEGGRASESGEVFGDFAPDDDVLIAGTDRPYPADKHPLRRALFKESSVVADIEIRTPGRRIPLEVWGSPVFDERGRVAYALSAFYDISERKKVERMKDEFVSVVSHELRTPLTSIQGAIGLLENGVLGALSDEALEMARIAREGCGRLLRLVNELLDIQKLEAGAPTLHPQPLPLGPVLEGAVAASRPYAAALGIRLDLDDAAPGAVVLADSDRLSQVVANLLSNAIKYTPEGERILVHGARLPAGGPDGIGTRVRVSVEDRGPGVPDEFVGRLFQKFSQADASDARQKGGTGLGLHICKVIVEKLGGTIAYQPAPGGGACFYFELPELRAS